MPFPVLALCALFVAGHESAAQDPPTADPELRVAQTAMSTCAAAAAEGRHPEALAQAKIAETAFRARLTIRPNDVPALVGLARTLGTCRIPSADFALMAELSGESVELLQRALDVEPDHWLARYMLALNYFRAPSFLGRSALAAREFDRLIAQQGERITVREYARPFEYRGLLWSRAGERDSAVAIWRRGLQLFPADSALRARLGDSVDSVPAPSRPAVSAPARIDTVRVVASRAAAATVQPSPSEHRVDRSQVMTTAGGMGDVLHAVQLQPGATRVGDSADLFARGGDPAETPTFIDGGRILSIARFEGLSGSTFGALDAWVVKSARFSTGGFSVQHGNALSGVLDVETEGRPRATQWRAGLGLAQAGATARIPIGATSGAWATLRGTHVGALLATHGRNDEFARAPYSAEAMAAFVAQPKPGTEYRAVGMVVRDASARLVDANGYRGPFDAEGATRALILSTQHLGSSRPALLRTNVALSERTTDWRFGVLARERTERSGLARAVVEYAPGLDVTIRSGVEGGRLSRAEEGTIPLTPTVAPGSPSLPLAADSGTWHGGAFVEGEMRVGRYRVLAGTRADRLPGETELTVDPRVSVSTRLGAWTTRLAAGQFHQGRWRAEGAIPDGGTPSGLPRQARHLVAGIEHDGAVTFKGEAFVKSYGEYGPHGSGPQIVDGAARGVDVVVQRPVGSRLTGWVGYSFLDADVTLADGRTARSPYDVTHTATSSATLRLARGTTLGTTMRYGSGRPFTPIVGVNDPGEAHGTPVYGAPTSEQLPAYVRWDARLMQYVPLRRSMLVTFVEVLNLLDRENVSGYVWDASYRARRPTTTFYSNRTIMIGFELQSR